jgi:hypothetical protein
MQCHVCYDDAETRLGCACRGTAHVACMARFASATGSARAWTTCGVCRANFSGAMRAALAAEWRAAGTHGALSACNLAAVYRDGNLLCEAEAVERAAMARASGDDRAVLATGLVSTLLMQGRLDDAVAMAEHGAAWGVPLSAASIALARHDYVAAETALRAMHAYACGAFGAGSRVAALVEANVAVAMLKQARYEPARAMLRAVLAKQTRFYGAGHAETLKTQMYLLECTSALGGECAGLGAVAAGLRAALGAGNKHAVRCALLAARAGNSEAQFDALIAEHDAGPWACTAVAAKMQWLVRRREPVSGIARRLHAMLVAQHGAECPDASVVGRYM